MLVEPAGVAHAAMTLANRDHVYVCRRTGLGIKAQEIGNDLVTIANGKGGVAELLNEHRVMKLVGQIIIPEVRVLLDDRQKSFATKRFYGCRGGIRHVAHGKNCQRAQ